MRRSLLASLVGTTAALVLGGSVCAQQRPRKKTSRRPASRRWCNSRCPAPRASSSRSCISRRRPSGRGQNHHTRPFTCTSRTAPSPSTRRATAGRLFETEAGLQGADRPAGAGQEHECRGADGDAGGPQRRTADGRCGMTLPAPCHQLSWRFFLASVRQSRGFASAENARAATSPAPSTPDWASPTGTGNAINGPQRWIVLTPSARSWTASLSLKTQDFPPLAVKLGQRSASSA